MDVFEFRKQRNRICDFYGNCSNCPLLELTYCNNIIAANEKQAHQLVDAVESWAKEHPIPTRQSQFLKSWPGADLDSNGIVDISPCSLDKNYRDENGKCAITEINCLKCRRDFWSQEIEELKEDGT